MYLNFNDKNREAASMTFKSDIEIAQSTKLKYIREIAAKVGFSEDDI